MGLVFTVFIIISLVYIYKKRDEEEEYLALKVVGYYLLGSFKFNFNSLIIPLGFALYLIFFKPSLNKNVKRLAATFGFIIFCVSSGIPAIEEKWESREIKIPIISDNINSIDFTSDLNKIKDKLKVKTPLDVNEFEVRYKKDGEIEQITYNLIDYENPKKIHYSVRYFNNTNMLNNKKNYSITRYKMNDIKPNVGILDSDYFFDNINKIKNNKIDYNFDSYTISLMGVKTNGGYNIKDRKTIYIDKNGNEKEIANDELPLEGAYIWHYGSVVTGNQWHSTSTGSDNASINYILEY